MVFAINAVESGPNNFAAFQNLAKQQGASPYGSPSTSAGNPTESEDGGFASSVRASGALVALAAMVGVFVL